MEIKDIQPYAKNAKEHPDKQLDVLARVVQEVGWRQNVEVNQEGVIVAGHGRYMAWVKYRAKYSLPDVWITDDTGKTVFGEHATFPLTADQEKMWRMADNQINAMTRVDMDLIIPELKELPFQYAELTGYDMNILLESQEDKFEKFDATIAKTVTGDVYQLGEHKIICGDSTNPETYRKLLENERARMIFTDPPYSIDYQSGSGLTAPSEKFHSAGKIMGDDRTPEEAKQFYKDVLARFSEFSTDDATLYWWFAMRLHMVNAGAWEESGWHVSQTIIWLKNSLIYSPSQLFHRIYEPCLVGWKQGKSAFQSRTFSTYTELWTVGANKFADYLDIWYQKRDSHKDYIHPTQKPVQLAERAIKRSTEQDDIVLDAFGGSGSTLIACEQLSRRARLIELDPKYVDAVVGRYCKFKEDKTVIKNGKEIQWTA